MEYMDRRASAAGWFLLGGLAGAAAALLMAPATGKKTRQQLAKGFRKSVDAASDLGDDLSTRAGEAASQVSRIADRAVGYATDVVNTTADALGSLGRDAERAAKRQQRA
jgi:gas vesicle protein